VVFLLLPAVTLGTGGLEWTAFFIAPNEGLWLPAFAGLVDVVVEIGGFSAEVLPVVSVVTLGLVVLFVERTPLCLEEEHIEIEVLLHEVDDSGLDVSNGVSEGAVVSILAIDQVFGELSAKFGLILFNMVEPLNSIVGQVAQVLLLASVSFSMVAHVRGVLAVPVLSPLVLVGMIEGAVLMVVLVIDLALLNLELLQVQMSDFLHIMTGRIYLLKDCCLKLARIVLRPLRPGLSVVVSGDEVHRKGLLGLMGSLLRARELAVTLVLRLVLGIGLRVGILVVEIGIILGEGRGGVEFEVMGELLTLVRNIPFYHVSLHVEGLAIIHLGCL
jgi:hypothetical protein